VPQDWEGFLTSLGEVNDITSYHASEKFYEVGPGDYGSLQHRDLTLLFKVQPEGSDYRSRVKADGTYSGSLIQMTFPKKHELGIMAVSMMAALIIWGSFAGGLLVRPDDLPKTYSDLHPKYILPFVSADNIRHIPEANQKHLFRRNYIKSTLDYYKAFSQMVLGYQVSEEKFMFPNSMAAFRSYYNTQLDRVFEVQQAQESIDNEIANDSSRALIRIPTVKGTSASQDLARLIRTMDFYQEGLTLNLEERRLFKSKFTADANYDMTLHGNIPPRRTDPSSEDISFKGNDDDETTMYKTAQKLALQAEKAHGFLNRKKTRTKVSPKVLQPSVLIAGSSKLVSFMAPQDYTTDSSKIDTLVASDFNPNKKVKVKEPLTGELDPTLVSKTIDRRKFELQLCYELALRRDQKTNGKMEFSWRIDSRGRISDLKLLRSTIRDKRMVSCVRQKIAAWKFPRPRRGSIKIKYPFSFTPRRG
jgi:hypothetical protein